MAAHKKVKVSVSDQGVLSLQFAGIGKMFLPLKDAEELALIMLESVSEARALLSADAISRGEEEIAARP